MKSDSQGSFQFDQEEPLEETRLLGHLALSRPLVFFDLETTGLDPQSDRIIQFAFLWVNLDRSQEEWMELVNPGIPIPPEAVRVHGITNDMVRDKPGFAAFAPKIKELVAGCDLAGFNVVRFDWPFLAAEMERHQQPLDLKQHRLVDAQVIFHKQEPRDLSAAYRFYCRANHLEAHDALGDVRATLAILDAQLARYVDLPRDVKELHDYCAPGESRWVTSDRKLSWRSSEAVIAFGKHKGRSLQWLHDNQPDYLRWMRDSDFSQETKAVIQAAIDGVYPSKKESKEDEE